MNRISLQTYLSIGKPIISSISGEAKDILTHNDCGFHLDSGDELGLTKIFNHLGNVSNSQYAEFSKNSKRLYKLNFLSENRKIQIFKNIFN